MQKVRKREIIMAEKKYCPLLPIDDVKMQGYEDALNFAMTNDKIHNVALSGSYGSGKSSVIATYEKKHPDTKFIHISLADFEEYGASHCGDEKSGISENVVNLLEGKILNQLLHQIHPKYIPQSNFRIKKTDSTAKKGGIVAFCILFIIMLLYTINFKGWSDFVASLPPGPQIFCLSWTTLRSLRIISGLVCFLMAGAAGFYMMNTHNLQKVFKNWM